MCITFGVSSGSQSSLKKSRGELVTCVSIGVVQVIADLFVYCAGNVKQEIKDLWHIWSIWSVCLSISFAKVRERMLSGADALGSGCSRERMLSGADAGADAGADRERIGSGCGRGFLSLWLAYRGHMTNGSGCGSGFPLYSLIGSDKSHDLESAPASPPASPPASAPFCLLLGRSITANGRRERIGSGCGSRFLTFDSNSTSAFFESDVLKSQLSSNVAFLQHNQKKSAVISGNLRYWVSRILYRILSLSKWFELLKCYLYIHCVSFRSSRYVYETWRGESHIIYNLDRWWLKQIDLLV